VSSNAIVARGGAAVIAAAAMIGGTGCEATFHTPGTVVRYYDDGDYVARADLVPPDIRVYPHTYYGGLDVYLVDGRWYYPSAGGWRIMRREPVELGRQRTRIYASPRYRPYRSPQYGYPQAPYESAPRYRTPTP
jgi:hypothetical protein